MKDVDIIYQYDVGTEIRTYLDNQDISDTDISLANFEVKKPDGTKVIWNSTGKDTDADGVYVYYISQSGDFNQVGLYKCQVYIELTSGWKGRSNIFYIKVEENI